MEERTEALQAQLEAAAEILRNVHRGFSADAVMNAAAMIKTLVGKDPVHAAGGCYCRECDGWMQSDVPGEKVCALTAASTKPEDFCSLGTPRNACSTCGHWNGELCTGGGYEPSAGMECVNWRRDGGT